MKTVIETIFKIKYVNHNKFPMQKFNNKILVWNSKRILMLKKILDNITIEL